MWLICGRMRLPRRQAFCVLPTILMAVAFCLRSVVMSLLGPGTVWKRRAYQFRGR
jgi:hypothetical protein